VARGLRLGRSTLIQVPAGGQHRLSYLLPALYCEVVRVG
jgi:ATP-dependent DNA helicase DinG